MSHFPNHTTCPACHSEFDGPFLPEGHLENCAAERRADLERRVAGHRDVILRNLTGDPAQRAALVRLLGGVQKEIAAFVAFLTPDAELQGRFMRLIIEENGSRPERWRKEDAMSLIDSDVCRCGCHTSRHIMHIVPCCTQCPICRKNIASFLAKRHVRACAENTAREVVSQLNKPAALDALADEGERRQVLSLLGGIMSAVETLVRGLTDDPEEQERVLALFRTDQDFTGKVVVVVLDIGGKDKTP